MSKKTKHGRNRQHQTPSTELPKEPKATVSAADRNVIAGEVVGALLGAITFGALQDNGPQSAR